MIKAHSGGRCSSKKVIKQINDILKMQIDRQTLLFFIIMFIFLSLPNGADKPHSPEEREALNDYNKFLDESKKILDSSDYYTGYGNLSGFELSYNDFLEGKNIRNWPFHNFTDEEPWIEDERYSILPNPITSKIKLFWGTKNVDIAPDAKSYLLNISGRVYGEFEKDDISNSIKAYNFELPESIKHYVESELLNKNIDEVGKDKDQISKDNAAVERIESDIDMTRSTPTKNGNVTFGQGKVSLLINNMDYNFKEPDLKKHLRLRERDYINDTVIVNIKLDIFDFPETNLHELSLDGIYYQEMGSIIGVTSSLKFAGLEGLPHLTFSEKNFNKSKILMEESLNSSFSGTSLSMDDLNTEVEKAMGQCEYISYIQLKKTNYSKTELKEIDEELKAPMGRPIPGKFPDIEIENMLLYSPDCGIVLQKKSNIPLAGQKYEVVSNKLRKCLMYLLFIIAFQLFLTLRQIKESYTPGKLALISTSSLGLLSFTDALIAISLILIAPLLDSLYLILSTVAVMSFILCVVFEVRFMVNVKLVQANEIGTPWWEILRGSVNRTNSSRNATTTGPAPIPNEGINQQNNTPVATNTANQPADVNEDQSGNDEARFSSGIITSGIFFAIVCTFLISSSLRWRKSYRSRFEFIALLFLYSFWIPQFFRNTLKNRRHSFTWEFILGTSTARLLPVWYLYLYDSNPLRHHQDPLAAAILSFWLLLQISLLYMQQRLEPRFWIKENWLPKAYDYHPVLSIHDLEDGFASDILSSIKNSSTDSSTGLISSAIDCAICMSEIPLQIHTKPTAASGKSTIDRMGSSRYMVTPCHHIFHTECLEDWMKFKLQCPVCRNHLPPS